MKLMKGKNLEQERVLHQEIDLQIIMISFRKPNKKKKIKLPTYHLMNWKA